MDYRKPTQFQQIPVIFNKTVQPGAVEHLEYECTADGAVKKIYSNFAVGEAGTLHIVPYIILNGNIRVDMAAFPGGVGFISGDNERIDMDVHLQIERHAKICLDVENTGADASHLDFMALVQYEEEFSEHSIVGYGGRNL